LSTTKTTGTVTFKDGATVLGSPVAIGNNQAQLSTAALGTGTHPIIASYSGDANYNPHTTIAFPQIVNQGASANGSSAAPNPAVVTQNVNLSATVTGGGPTPTGNVTFKDGATTIGAPVALVAGVANTSTTFATVGSHSLTAVYSGDANYAGSTSA